MKNLLNKLAATVRGKCKACLQCMDSYIVDSMTGVDFYIVGSTASVCLYRNSSVTWSSHDLINAVVSV